jgi:DNA mismatch endonuclease (patch repair protein)
MPDVFSRRKRSAVMAAIRSRGNKATELRLAAVFRAQGIAGWRRQRSLPLPVLGSSFLVLGSAKRTSKGGQAARVPNRRVRPDFVFSQKRVAVFVDGCFWHGCPTHYRRPGSRRAFWDAKLATNRARDRLVNRTLRRAGRKVLRVWEHELTRKNERRLMLRLEHDLG